MRDDRGVRDMRYVHKLRLPIRPPAHAFGLRLNEGYESRGCREYRDWRLRRFGRVLFRLVSLQR